MPHSLLPTSFPCTVSGKYPRESALSKSSGECRADYRAIQAVQLESVLDKLPQGLDAPLGPGATSLSGGERQRLALARSLLRKSARSYWMRQPALTNPAN